MKEYDAYLFDADGTLIDTRELIYRSYVHMSGVMGLPEPDRGHVERTTGLPFADQIRDVLGRDRGEEFYERASEVYRGHLMDSYRPHLRIFPGEREVLDELRLRGKKMAVVTSRRLPGLVEFLRFLGLDGYFSLLVTPESTERHKPHPEPALFAMRELGAAPERTVFVGDAIFDIKCGHAAGADTVLVAWGGMDHRDWDPQPDYVIDSFAELLPS